MHAVILAAGEGSRMGEYTEEVPKAFMEISGRTLYDYQREAIDPHIDAVTVALGYRHENVLDRLRTAEHVVVEAWDEYDNAESLYRALEVIDDDVLVLNGDVVVTPAAVERVRRRYRALDGESVVVHLPEVQNEHTAIQLDDDGRVVDYGEITGYRHAGMGILDRDHIDDAAAHLRRNRADWYPSMYIDVPTRGVAIPETDHVEINRPRDRRAAKGRLPLS
ncbi:NTP transferase domain-containing protein [Halorarum salinum]|uniref:NTP transferase domain-containing protein n=1 Tax=Halorarum salinum TaxID=2743089 RepID=A0A7D5LER4_9EURY|nr:NTP transferase domain-containing protein [Halobaculum salinum]QLG64215.1 NTP transferase domain-containing protein [Halobaculum salinum]